MQSVFAQSDTSTFNIRVYGGLDAIPPTTPTLLSATPFSSSQIDISWSASADDVFLGGYSVLRDGVPIATTTLLNYSDTGLSASTTYGYEVRAFDSSINYSTTSNSISTTTLPIVTTPTTDDNDSPTQGTASRVVLDKFSIRTGVSTTSLSLNTARLARLEVRWGKTTSYELGYSVSGVYSTQHNIFLTDLEPGTKYQYEIIGYSIKGFKTPLKSGVFETGAKDIAVSLPNVSYFQAVGRGSDVNLSWRIPSGATISHVRIVRSYIDYPRFPQDGAIVYNGTKDSVTDYGVLQKYSPVYYTAFVYDVYGNVSSGAVDKVYAVLSESNDNENNIKKPDYKTEPIEIVKPIITPEATSSVETKRLTVDMKMPKLDEIRIDQGDNTFSLSDDDIVLDSDRYFVVSIPKDKIAGNLKSIIVTIVDPTDNRKAYSYLLKINQGQTDYKATIEPFGVVGKSELAVNIYDYEAYAVATFKSPITFVEVSEPVKEEVIFPDAVFNKVNIGIGVGSLLLVFFIVFMFIRSRQG